MKNHLFLKNIWLSLPFATAVFLVQIIPASAQKSSASAPHAVPGLPADSPVQNPAEIVGQFRSRFGQAKTRFVIYFDRNGAEQVAKNEKILSDYDITKIQTLFMKPFLAANAQFVRPGPNSDKDADIAIDIVAREHAISVPTPGGDSSTTRLDLIVNAYDLKQGGLLLGQISSETLFKFGLLGGMKRNVGQEELVDQTALALMDKLTK